MTSRGFVSGIVHALAFNRPLSIIVLIGIISFGALAYMGTPKQYNPEIIRPAFFIETEYPGASAEEVDMFITRELVELVRDIPHVDEVTAISKDGGRSIVTVVFDVGVNVEEAKVSLYTRVMQSYPRAQGAMREPVIKTITPDDVPIITIALYSNSYIQNDVRTKVITLMHELQEVPGVANLKVHGGSPRALLVHIDPEALRTHGLTVGHIQDAIEQSIYSPNAGVIANGNEVVSISIEGANNTAENVRSLPIAPGILLNDLAYVEDAWSETSSYVRFSEEFDTPQNAVYISIAKRPGDNAPSVSKAVRESFESRIAEPRFKDLRYDIVRDDGLIAQKEIRGLSKNLITSIVIVGLVLMLFLSYRPALAVITAIPLTLLLVFFVAFLAGETINRITLFALILSLGLLVDSATVVVENINRHISQAPEDEQDKSVVRAVEQISAGLILSAITSVVVFLPVRFITGMMGPYMGPLSFFVPTAILASLLIAFFVTPFLSYTLLKGDAVKNTKKPIFSGFFEKMKKGYGRLLKKLLYNEKLKTRVLRTSVGLLILSLSLPFFGLVHFQMLPKADKEQFYIHLDMADGTDVPKTLTTARAIEKSVFENKHVVSTQLFVAEPPIVDFNGMFKGVQYRSGTHQATLRINLTEPEKRDKSSSKIVTDIRERLSKILVPAGTHIRVLEDPPGPPVQATFVAKVFGPDTETRERLARIVESFTASTKGVVDIDTSIPEAAPKLKITVREEEARIHGVRPKDVERTISLLFDPTDIGQYHLKGSPEYAPIIISLPRDERLTPHALDRIDVRSINGASIPLSTVASYNWERTTPSINTEQLRHVTYVTAETNNRSIVYVLIDMIKSLKDYKDEYGEITEWNLFGLTYTDADKAIYTIEWGGEWKMTLDNFRDLGVAMLVALFLVYGILVAKYSSFRTPALVMTTVPFGLIGILPGFFFLDLFFDIYLTATALIGFIALIGIVVNNAIIYLEYINELKKLDSEKDDREILIEAGKMRLRPIVLTSLTTVLGSMTIASDPVWSGLAWAIIFGLSLSTILTLILFPLLYSQTPKKHV